jgi:hypothetical protein
VDKINNLFCQGKRREKEKKKGRKISQTKEKIRKPGLLHSLHNSLTSKREHPSHVMHAGRTSLKKDSTNPQTRGTSKNKAKKIASEANLR